MTISKDTKIVAMNTNDSKIILKLNKNQRLAVKKLNGITAQFNTCKSSRIFIRLNGKQLPFLLGKIVLIKVFLKCPIKSIVRNVKSTYFYCTQSNSKQVTKK